MYPRIELTRVDYDAIDYAIQRYAGVRYTRMGQAALDYKRLN